MFNLIGRYYGSRLNWFRPMRRLAKGNPVDFGKTFVFCYVMAGVGYAMKWAMLRYVAKATGTTVESIFEPVKQESYLNAVDHLNPGDTIIYADDHENVEGVFVRMTEDGLLVDLGESGQCIIPKSSVLDVTPAF